MKDVYIRLEFDEWGAAKMRAPHSICLGGLAWSLLTQLCQLLRSGTAIRGGPFRPRLPTLDLPALDQRDAPLNAIVSGGHRTVPPEPPDQVSRPRGGGRYHTAVLIQPRHNFILTIRQATNSTDVALVAARN